MNTKVFGVPGSNRAPVRSHLGADGGGGYAYAPLSSITRPLVGAAFSFAAPASHNRITRGMELSFMDPTATPASRFNELPTETQEFLSKLQKEDIALLAEG